MHYICDKNYLSFFFSILKFYPYLDADDGYGYRPLLYAIRNNNHIFVRYLLYYGASPWIFKQKGSYLRRKKDKTFKMYYPLIKFAQKISIEVKLAKRDQKGDLFYILREQIIKFPLEQLDNDSN